MAKISMCPQLLLCRMEIVPGTPKGPGTGRGLVSSLITPIPENLKCLLCIRALKYKKHAKSSMTLLPENLKKVKPSNWDFHLITDFK